MGWEPTERQLLRALTCKDYLAAKAEALRRAGATSTEAASAMLVAALELLRETMNEIEAIEVLRRFADRQEAELLGGI